MLVRELMSANVCFIRADAPVSDAAALMKKYDIGMVPVCDSKGCLLGLITDRDIVLRFLAAEGGKDTAPCVSDVMSQNAVSVSPDMDIHDAACVFSRARVRRLPVLDDSRLVGMLSLTDLAKKRVFLAEVGDIMGAIAGEKKSAAKKAKAYP